MFLVFVLYITFMQVYDHHFASFHWTSAFFYQARPSPKYARMWKCKINYNTYISYSQDEQIEHVRGSYLLGLFVYRTSKER